MQIPIRNNISDQIRQYVYVILTIGNNVNVRNFQAMVHLEMFTRY